MPFLPFLIYENKQSVKSNMIIIHLIISSVCIMQKIYVELTILLAKIFELKIA